MKWILFSFHFCSENIRVQKEFVFFLSSILRVFLDTKKFFLLFYISMESFLKRFLSSSFETLIFKEFKKVNPFWIYNNHLYYLGSHAQLRTLENDEKRTHCSGTIWSPSRCAWGRSWCIRLPSDTSRHLVHPNSWAAVNRRERRPIYESCKT